MNESWSIIHAYTSSPRSSFNPLFSLVSNTFSSLSSRYFSRRTVISCHSHSRMLWVTSRGLCTQTHVTWSASIPRHELWRIVVRFLNASCNIQVTTRLHATWRTAGTDQHLCTTRFFNTADSCDRPTCAYRGIGPTSLKRALAIHTGIGPTTLQRGTGFKR